MIYGGKDLWKRCALSLNWKRVGEIDGRKAVAVDEVHLYEWNEKGIKEHG